jgi:hypothetical protein
VIGRDAVVLLAIGAVTAFRAWRSWRRYKGLLRQLEAKDRALFQRAIQQVPPSKRLDIGVPLRRRRDT